MKSDNKNLVSVFFACISLPEHLIRVLECCYPVEKKNLACIYYAEMIKEKLKGLLDDGQVERVNKYLTD